MYCLTINKNGDIDEHKTFKGFTNASNNLDRKEYFKMFQGDKLVAKVPLSWEKNFSYGVIIALKMRICNKCAKDILCDGRDNLVNQNKEILANLNQIKGQDTKDVGHMLPKNITN